MCFPHKETWCRNKPWIRTIHRSSFNLFYNWEMARVLRYACLQEIDAENVLHRFHYDVTQFACFLSNNFINCRHKILDLLPTYMAVTSFADDFYFFKLMYRLHTLLHISNKSHLWISIGCKIGDFKICK